MISQLFLYLSETEGILDSEIKISGFSIVRCDHSSRTGGPLIFSPDDFINCIDITDSVIYDHHIIPAKVVSQFLSLLPLVKL